MDGLRLLSPQNVLDRGYSLTFDADTGTLVRSADALSPGSRLRTRLASGEVSSQVTGTPAASEPAPAAANRRSPTVD